MKNSVKEGARTILPLILAWVFLTGCTYQEIKGGVQEGQGGDPIAGLDFLTIQNQIFNSPAGKCKECHVWTNNYALVTSDGRLGRMLDRVNRTPGSQGYMPKDNAPLSPELKNLLAAWINAGAPEFADSEPVDPVDPVEPVDPNPPGGVEKNWASISQKIIEPYCLRCHREPDFLNDGVVLVTYEDVLSRKNKIRKAVEDRRMPEDTRLPDELRQALLEWIDEGLNK